MTERLPRNLLALLALTALACASRSTPPNEESTPEGLIGKQHVAVLSLAAWYYCENGDWPSSLAKLKSFDEERERGLGVARDWPWLLGPDVRLITAESYQLLSRYEIAPGDFRVMRSGQDRPTCTPGETELNDAFLKLSDDRTH